MATYGDDIVIQALKSTMRARQPVMIVGQPGVGKTATVRAIAKEMGYELITLLGSTMDSTDLVGLPSPKELRVIDFDGNEVVEMVTAYLKPWWQARILATKKVIVFLDEYSTASPSVQASMLTFLQNREFGDGSSLPRETIVIGAMNPQESAGQAGNELSMPTVNRIVFLPWQLSHDSWYKGMLDAWGEKVSPAELKWKRRIVSFIKDNPSQLHREPNPNENIDIYGAQAKDPSNAEIARTAWASMRSWDNLSKVLANAPEAVYVQDLLAQGTVGWAAAQDFRIWLQSNNEMSPYDVLRDPSSVDWANASLNDTALLFRAIIEMVGPTTVGAVLKLIKTILDSGNGSILGPYYQELFKNLTDPSIVGEEIAPKALKAIQRLLPLLTPFIETD